ncbi:serine hydrolase domain-containing protein [Nonomuraea sp. NPDC052116]|uniref:serine hydrolase domain-containing protein n=1 Tax=Nonomuraea sp. NPDC052116 TaxID=3155665 RepID=UPI0034381AF1
MQKALFPGLTTVLMTGLLVCGLSGGAAAASIDLEDVGTLVDQVVPAQLAAHGIPGAAVTVVSGGRQVFSRGYGYADLAGRVPVDAARTGFFAASTAKTFTAIAALQLVQEGKLDLRADVNTYLKTFKIENTFPGRPVTLEHLLTHTAGFADNVLGSSWEDPGAAEPLAEVVKNGRPERVRPPGTVLAYDNYAYNLAGYLVEVASGQPFAEYVRSRILAPLGMEGTSFKAPLPTALLGTLARGYNGDVPYKRYYGSPASGAGPVTTAADMGRLMIALLGDDPRLGRNVGTTMMTRHYTQDDRLPGMGYGLEETARNGRRIFSKGGDINGFHHVLALLPDQGTGVYVVFNGEDSEAAAAELVDRVVDRYFPGKPEQPRPVRGDTSAYAGTYTSTRIPGDLLRFGALFTNVTVEAAGDGTITTTGLSRDPARPVQTWQLVGPGLFAERGGQERIAFDGHGLLAGGHQEEAATFERSAAGLHVWLVYAGLAAFALAGLGMPVVALVRRLRGRPARHRAAWWLAWLTGVLVLVFAYGLAVTIVIAPTDAIFLGSPLLTAALIASSTAFVLSGGVLACSAGAWWKGWWGPAGRISYTAFALVSAGFMAVAYAYHMVGGVFG